MHYNILFLIFGFACGLIVAITWKCDLAMTCKSTKPFKKSRAMVVYAYDRMRPGSPWIYGIYKDEREGSIVMEEMQESKEYRHLAWSNNIVEIH